MRNAILAALLSTSILVAQDATAAAALPAANSPEAAALLDKACAKMLAVGRGTFTTTEEQDNAMMRGQNLPFGGEAIEVTGGWNGDLLWGVTGDDDRYARKAGRLVVKTDEGWRLRSKKLASGAPTPFTVDPATLFAFLQKLPSELRRVSHVEAGEVAQKPVGILTLSVEGAAAADLALAGVLPDNQGGPMFALGGMHGGMPEKSYRVDLALFVDPQSGDVHRLRAKVYEDDPMLANVRFQLNDGGGDADVTVGGEADAKEPAAQGDGKVKKGLPERSPAKTESVMYFKVDFKTLGLAEQPALDDQAKAWLGLR